MVKPKPLGLFLTMIGALRVLIKGDKSLNELEIIKDECWRKKKKESSSSATYINQLLIKIRKKL